MAKSKLETVTIEPEAAAVSSAVAERLAARLAEAQADWTALVVEAAMLGVTPPPAVIEDVAARLRLDQPQLRFRLAAEAFRTAVAKIKTAHVKLAQRAELENEIGSPEKLKARIAELETRLAEARNLLRKHDFQILGCNVPIGEVQNICREWSESFSLLDVERASGLKLPAYPGRK